MKKPALVIKDLELKRGHNFSLSIKNLYLKNTGTVCLTGANGSGKTTLLEIVTGLILPDKGSVMVVGLDPFKNSLKCRRHFGYAPDDDGWIIAELTAREYFELLAAIYKRAGVTHDLLKEAYTLAEELMFRDFNRLLGHLSHGNRKKIQLIAGLMHRPKLLVVDELRNGLDPLVIKRAENLISQYSKKATVLAATHDLWWAERFSDDLIMISDGRIVYQQPTAEIVRDYGSVETRFMELYESSVA